MDNDDKLTKILEELSELKNEMKHFTQQMDGKSDEIKKLNDIIPEVKAEISQLKNEVKNTRQTMNDMSKDIESLKDDVSNLKIQLALNDQKTNKMDKWAVTVLSCVMTIMLGFIAIKLGLK